ncbi:hypothetical protein [Nostoc sp.]
MKCLFCLYPILLLIGKQRSLTDTRETAATLDCFAYNPSRQE